MKKFVATILVSAFVCTSVYSQSPGDSKKDHEIIITIMPNPVRNNTIIFKMEGLSAKTYFVKIISEKGGVAASEKFSSPTSTSFKMIQLQQQFKGYGRVQILNENGKLVGQSRFLAAD